MFKKNISKFEKSNISKKMRENETNELCNNTAKLTNFSVLVLKKDVSLEIGDIFSSKYNSLDFYLWPFQEFCFNFQI